MKTVMKSIMQNKQSGRSFFIVSILLIVSLSLMPPAALRAEQDKKGKEEKKNEKKDKDDKDKPKETYVIKKLTQGMNLYQLGSISPDKTLLSLIAQKEGGT